MLDAGFCLSKLGFREFRPLRALTQIGPQTAGNVEKLTIPSLLHPIYFRLGSTDLDEVVQSTVRQAYKHCFPSPRPRLMSKGVSTLFFEASVERSRDANHTYSWSISMSTRPAGRFGARLNRCSVFLLITIFSGNAIWARRKTIHIPFFKCDASKTGSTFSHCFSRTETAPSGTRGSLSLAG